MAVLSGVIAAASTAGAYAAITGSHGPAGSGTMAVAPVSTGLQEDPQRVTPRPGMTNVHPIPWRKAEPLSDRTVRVVFDSGVEPCYVLDHITVDYLADSMVITLYQGSDSGSEHTACIQIAVQKTTDVTLDQPLGGRTIVDGSPSR